MATLDVPIQSSWFPLASKFYGPRIRLYRIPKPMPTTSPNPIGILGIGFVKYDEAMNPKLGLINKVQGTLTCSECQRSRTMASVSVSFTLEASVDGLKVLELVSVVNSRD